MDRRRVFVFALYKSSTQTRFIHLVSVTVFTAPWHNPSKGLYKHRRLSLKSYQRCNSAFIYMFSMQSTNGCAFICVFNSMGAKWNCMKLCVFSVSPLPPPLRCTPRPLFKRFFKTVVRTNQCWNRGFHDPLKPDLINGFVSYNHKAFNFTQH